MGKSMIRRVEGFKKYIGIAGFKNVKISDYDSFFKKIREEKWNTSVQFFNSKLIAGPDHLFFAALNALNNFKNKINISNNIAIEILLFSSAQRQIRKAIDMIGINQKSSQIAILVINETRLEVIKILEAVSKYLIAERDDSVILLDSEKFERIRNLFQISDLELKSKLNEKGYEKEALVDLVIERMSLLTTSN
jgi:tRNA threonylcarbamoyladenosine modification (KEOPS) complex Cgi121 subunit